MLQSPGSRVYSHTGRGVKRAIRLAVFGLPARYSTFDTGTGVIWTLRFDRDGLDVSLSASFDDMAALVAIAESMLPIAPSAGRALSPLEFTGGVVSRIGADTVVVVLSDGSREVVRLVRLRAPRPATGGRRAGCRFRLALNLLRRALPRGAEVLVGSDPLRRARDARGRVLGYVSRVTLADPEQYANVTVQDRLLSAGAVRLAAGRYRYRSQLAPGVPKRPRPIAGCDGLPGQLGGR